MLLSSYILLMSSSYIVNASVDQQYTEDNRFCDNETN